MSYNKFHISANLSHTLTSQLECGLSTSKIILRWPVSPFTLQLKHSICWSWVGWKLTHAYSRKAQNKGKNFEVLKFVNDINILENLEVSNKKNNVRGKHKCLFIHMWQCEGTGQFFWSQRAFHLQRGYSRFLMQTNINLVECHKKKHINMCESYMKQNCDVWKCV